MTPRHCRPRCRATTFTRRLQPASCNLLLRAATLQQLSRQQLVETGLGSRFATGRKLLPSFGSKMVRVAAASGGGEIKLSDKPAGDGLAKKEVMRDPFTVPSLSYPHRSLDGRYSRFPPPPSQLALSEICKSESYSGALAHTRLVEFRLRIAPSQSTTKLRVRQLTRSHRPVLRSCF